MSDTVIVKAKIHPAIGVARVGNAETEYFIGPEVIDPPRALPQERRDDDGALKRQAALFRIYGYNAAGEVVSELTADTAAIEWQVELANLKPAWYQFQIALDIPEAATATPSLLRNKDEPDRTKLAISGGKHASPDAARRRRQHLSRSWESSLTSRFISASCRPTQPAAFACWVDAARPAACPAHR